MTKRQRITRALLILAIGHLIVLNVGYGNGGAKGAACALYGLSVGLAVTYGAFETMIFPRLKARDLILGLIGLGIAVGVSHVFHDTLGARLGTLGYAIGILTMLWILRDLRRG